MSKTYWNISSNSSEVIVQGQAAKPFLHEKGPRIIFPSDSLTTSNACLCSYKYYRYYAIYAKLDEAANIPFYKNTQDGQIQYMDPPDNTDWEQGFLDYTIEASDGWQWELMGSRPQYHYIGCYPKGAFECGVWKPVAGFIYSDSLIPDPSPSYIYNKTPYGGSSFLRMVVNSYKCCKGKLGCGIISNDPFGDGELLQENGYFCQAIYMVYNYNSEDPDSITAQLQQGSQRCGKGHHKEAVDYINCDQARIRIYREIIPLPDTPIEDYCQDCFQLLQGTAISHVVAGKPACVVWVLWYKHEKNCTITVLTDILGVGWAKVTDASLFNIPSYIWGKGDGELPVNAHIANKVYSICGEYNYRFVWKSYPLGTINFQPPKDSQLTSTNPCEQGCSRLDPNCPSVDDQGDLIQTSDSLSRSALIEPCNLPDPPPLKYIDIYKQAFYVYTMDLDRTFQGGSALDQCYDKYQIPFDQDNLLAWNKHGPYYDYQLLIGYPQLIDHALGLRNNYWEPQKEMSILLPGDQEQTKTYATWYLVLHESQDPPYTLQEARNVLPAGLSLQGDQIQDSVNKCSLVCQLRLFNCALTACWVRIGNVSSALYDELQARGICLGKWQVGTLQNSFQTDPNKVPSYVYTTDEISWKTKTICYDSRSDSKSQCSTQGQGKVVYTEYGFCGKGESSIGDQGVVGSIKVPMLYKKLKLKYKEYTQGCNYQTQNLQTQVSGWKNIELTIPCYSGLSTPQGFYSMSLLWDTEQCIPINTINSCIQQKIGSEAALSPTPTQQGTLKPGYFTPPQNADCSFPQEGPVCKVYYIHTISETVSPVWTDSDGQYCNKLLQEVVSDSFSISTPQIDWDPHCNAEGFGIKIFVLGPTVWRGLNFKKVTDCHQQGDYIVCQDYYINESHAIRTMQYLQESQEAFYEKYKCGSDSASLTTYFPTGFYEWTGGLALDWTKEEQNDKTVIIKSPKLTPVINLQQNWTLTNDTGPVDTWTILSQCSLSWRLFIYTGWWYPCMDIQVDIEKFSPYSAVLTAVGAYRLKALNIRRQLSFYQNIGWYFDRWVDSDNFPDDFPCSLTDNISEYNRIIPNIFKRMGAAKSDIVLKYDVGGGCFCWVSNDPYCLDGSLEALSSGFNSYDHNAVKSPFGKISNTGWSGMLICPAPGYQWRGTVAHWRTGNAYPLNPDEYISGDGPGNIYYILKKTYTGNIVDTGQRDIPAYFQEFQGFKRTLVARPAPPQDVAQLLFQQMQESNVKIVAVPTRLYKGTYDQLDAYFSQKISCTTSYTNQGKAIIYYNYYDWDDNLVTDAFVTCVTQSRQDPVTTYQICHDTIQNVSGDISQLGCTPAASCDNNTITIDECMFPNTTRKRIVGGTCYFVASYMPGEVGDEHNGFFQGCDSSYAEPAGKYFACSLNDQEARLAQIVLDGHASQSSFTIRKEHSFDNIIYFYGERWDEQTQEYVPTSEIYGGKKQTGTMQMQCHITLRHPYRWFTDPNQRWN